MCGVYGMVSFNGVLRWPQLLESMGHVLSHRGPDDRQLIVEPNAALGTERLRITDPRPEGAQPFTDPSSQIWMSCNGAIYNADELRARFTGYPFRSRSDVETLVPLYLESGLDSFEQLDGMFAAVVWDGRTQRLLLARDRSGEKPLFYLELDGEIWFASEIQALLLHPQLTRTIDRAGLSDYLRLGYAREPRTMFERIHKVESGTVLAIDATGQTATRYWSPEHVALTDVPPDAAESTLESLLVQAVNKQVRADVPVGVFTSGGVDSALLAVLAREAVGARNLRTFTVGFEDASYDERAPAARLARHINSEHVEIALGEERMQEAFDIVSERVAEPVADPAILPTYLLARVARKHVGVVLSGEGADELFGGYPTYLGHRYAPSFTRLPATLRAALQVAAGLLPPSESKVPLGFLLKRFVAHADRDLLTRHVAWFGTGLPDHLVPPQHEAAAAEQRTTDGDPLRRVMLFDYLTYLPDNLLAKVDRATMLNSLETRSPYLDREVVRFALNMTTDLKIRGTTTKWLLKRIAAHRLPRSIVHRRKRGLSVPVGRWLNEGLRTESDRLLNSERLSEVGLLKAEPVRQLLFEHRSRRADHTRALWALVVLERWRERWI